VFRKKIEKERVMFGKTVPEHERFPSDESFGDWAWSYREYKDAMKKFNEIENEPIKSES